MSLAEELDPDYQGAQDAAVQKRGCKSNGEVGGGGVPGHLLMMPGSTPAAAGRPGLPHTD